MKINCDECSIVVDKPIAWVKKVNHHFCSRICSGKFRSKNMTGKSLGGEVTKKCLGCGFNFKSFKSEKRKCCSKKCSQIVSIGRKPWNTGFTKDTHSSLLLISKKLSGEHNPMYGRSGKTAGHWNGGITSLQMSIRTSETYKKWRSSVFERDCWECVLCNKNSNLLQADHIVPFSLIVSKNRITDLGEALGCNELWDISNGQTLCKSCHKIKTASDYNQIIWRPNVH